MTVRGRAPALLALLLPFLVAHVGTDTVIFEGDAGPYPVRVTVRPPGVVPGLASILVRVTGAGVDRVLVRPVRWDAGLDGAPRPDPAAPVEGAPGLYAAELWLMTSGSYSVHVTVEGDAGTGTAVVPVQSVARRTLAMDRALGAALLGACAFLFLGALTLVGAAAREGTLEPGAVPDAGRRRAARVAAAIAAAILALAVTGGKHWWDAVDGAYREKLYRPLHAIAAARVSDDGARGLTLAIDDARWPGRFTPLVPDHGKLMHMFLVRAPGLDAFAHIHPVRVDSARFHVALPPLPGGRYRLYADILHESGFTQTLTDTVDVPPAPDDAGGATGHTASPGANAGRRPTAPTTLSLSNATTGAAGAGTGPSAARDATGPAVAPDPDDSWSVFAAVPAAAGTPAPGPGGTGDLGDGFTMTWAPPEAPIRVGRDLTLRFAVRGPDGGPAPLSPYMGMPAHAAVSRDDGAVFVHLHPMGTISAGAQRRLAAEIGAAGSEAATPHHGPPRFVSGIVTFPFAFPRPGRYRIWVQVATDAGVKTGVFDTIVRP
ncbi:MAG TPA: hypothetical protein VF212_00885 [Longimicrobiales bacterium]